MEVVIIGTTEFLPGFALAGARKTILAKSENVLAKIAEHRDASLIILEQKLTETLSSQQREELETSVRPVIITLSKDSGKRERLKRAIMTTLGVDLIK